MTIDVFSICYNEELLLPHFIKHYQSAPFNANITIFDNRSTDNSREIINAAGCTLIDYNSQDEIRDDLYLKIKNNCWKKSKADIVIICDIDEFLMLPTGINLSKCSIVKSKGYDIVGTPPSRLGVPNKMYNKIIMFRPNQVQEIFYSPGCHTANPIGNVIYNTQSVPLFHYKYISPEYLYERHLMYEKRLSFINKNFGWGDNYINNTKGDINKKFEELKKNSIDLSIFL